MPKAAVVTITCERCPSYAQALYRARKKIQPKELGITELKVQRAVNGDVLMEIPEEGEEVEKKADLLVGKMRDILVLGKGQFRISRPRHMATLRVGDLDDSIRPNDVTSALARVTGGKEEDLKAEEEDSVRRGRGGLGSFLMRCLLIHALRAEEVGRIRVGFWSESKCWKNAHCCVLSVSQWGI